MITLPLPPRHDRARYAYVKAGLPSLENIDMLKKVAHYILDQANFVQDSLEIVTLMQAGHGVEEDKEKFVCECLKRWAETYMDAFGTPPPWVEKSEQA